MFNILSKSNHEDYLEVNFVNPYKAASNQLFSVDKGNKNKVVCLAKIDHPMFRSLTFCAF